MERKKMLYKTGVEYGDYAMNHALGCAHDCSYCYARMNAKRYGRVKSDDQWRDAEIVENTIELLETELPRLADKIENVHLCFTTDPFMMKRPDIQKLSLDCIGLINSYDVPVTVLTKGILPFDQIEQRDFLMSNWYGVTFTSFDEHYRLENEPNSAPAFERLRALERLSERGCKTWVSIEPYPTPDQVSQTLMPILESVAFVDRIIFGKLNHVKGALDWSPYYSELAFLVSEFCEQREIDCHIKEGTA